MYYYCFWFCLAMQLFYVYWNFRNCLSNVEYLVHVCVVCEVAAMYVCVISWRQLQTAWWSRWTLTSMASSVRLIAVWKQVGVYSSGLTASCYHSLKPTGFVLKQRSSLLNFTSQQWTIITGIIAVMSRRSTLLRSARIIICVALICYML